LNLEPETSNLEPGTLNLLYIGWASLNPVFVPENGTVLLIHARLKEDFRISHFTFGVSHFESDYSNANPEMRNVKSEIRFTLNTSPLSELADGEGNVIEGAILSVADAGFKVQGSRFREEARVVVYPNPAHETLNLELVTPFDGTTLNLELVNLQGVSVMRLDLGIVDAGLHLNNLDLRGLAPGVYFLRVTMGGETVVKKVVIRNE
jgi:hypothetical protein